MERIPKPNPERERLIFEVMEALLEQRPNGLDPKNHAQSMSVFEIAQTIINSGKAQEFLQAIEDQKRKTTEEDPDLDWMDMSASDGEDKD